MTPTEIDRFRDSIVPLLVVKQDIEEKMWRQPSAMMLPLSVFPGAEMVYGLPIVRGDRFALLYEAP